MSNIKILSLEDITLDNEIQPRVTMNLIVVNDYKEDLITGAEFPPIVVFYDGYIHWLTDGWHRYYAHDGLDIKTIKARVIEGSKRDAILYACGVNGEHGRRRTNEDKRKAVNTLLNDKEWNQKSDRWIAEQCKVSDHLVASVRGEIDCENSQSPQPTENKEESNEIPKKRTPIIKKGKDGREINTSNIGNKIPKKRGRPKESKDKPKNTIIITCPHCGEQFEHTNIS